MTPPIEQLPTPPLEQTPIPLASELGGFIGQMPTPPIERNTPLPRIGGPMTLGQASPFESIFNLADEPAVIRWAPKTPGSGLDMRRGSSPRFQPQAKPVRDWQVHSDDG
ncbi:hypothetical protein FRC11_001576, partial [Ceratobasidium sp. 423]